MIFILQFVPLIGSRELEGKAAKQELALGMTSERTAGARAMGGCCYGDQRAEIR